MRVLHCWFLLLGVAAASAAAQEPVLLRISPAAGGRPIRYRTEVETWLTSPSLAQGDAALPTFRLVLFTLRTAAVGDSGLVFTEVTDSSAFDMPRLRSAQPQLATSGDFLRGMRTETRMDARGRSVTSRVIAAPNLTADLLIRGMQSLAIAGLRLSTFSLPELPVGPGDTWTDSLRYELGTNQGLAGDIVTGGGAGQATFRFDRLERRGSARVALLSASGEVQMAGQAPSAATATAMTTATAQMELDVDTGRVLRSQAELSGPMATRLGIVPVRLRVTMRQQ